MQPHPRLKLWRRLGFMLGALIGCAGALAGAQDYSSDAGLAQSEFTVAAARPSLGELIASIERQTPFRFTYSKEQVPLDRPVDLPAGKTTVAEAMKQSALATGVDFRRIGRQIAVVPPGENTLKPTPRTEESAVVLDTFTVSSGEWGALEKAIETRRNSDRLVDSVQSTDIGILPDFNVAEAVQRLPGISIDLDQAEARYITIRGFNANYNTMTINGSIVAATERNTRRVEMDALPASLASSVEITKSQTPDLEGHSVGGAIDVRGPQAIRSRPLTFKFSSKIGTYTNDEGYDRTQPSGTADFTLTRRLGPTMGLALSGNFYRRDSYTPQSEFGSSRLWYDNSGAPVTAPYGGNGYAVPTERRWYWYHNFRTREGGSAKWEWRPDKSTELWTLSYYNTAIDDESRQTDLLTNWNAARVTNQTATSGVLSTAAMRQQEFLGKFHFRRSIWGNQFGARRWLDDTHRLSLLASHSGSTFRNPENWAEWRQTGAQLAVEYQQVGDLFYFRDVNPAARANLAAYTPFRRQFDYRDLKERVYEVQADFEGTSLLRVPGLGYKAGAKFRRTERTFNEEQDSYLPTATNTYTLAAANVLRTDLALQPPGALPGQSIFVIDPRAARENFWTHLAANPSQWTFNAMTDNDNNVDYTTAEDVKAAYAMANFAREAFKFTAGVRVEDTSYDSRGRVRTNGTWGPNTTSGGYRSWMPSAVASYRLGAQMRVLANYSETIGRPAFNQFAPVGESIVDNSGILTITRSNPNLKPRRSQNANLTLEYYFDQRAGLAAVSVFQNRVRNEIFTAAQALRVTFNGEPREATVTQPTNNPNTTTFTGLELLLMRDLDFLPRPLDGFKFNANLTLISTDFRILMTDGTLFRTRTAISQPHTAANIALLYSKRAFSGRVAWNYTGIKLTERVNTADSYRNRYDVAVPRLTANFTYEINRHWQLTASGWNLTGAGRKEVLGRAQELPIVTADFGRAYFAGFNYVY
jgi:TonB-dependent receptor